jgi:hypothetical protein
MKQKHFIKQLSNFAFFLSGAFLIVSLMSNLLLAKQVSAADKVDVCHWTAAGKYVSINVSVNSVNKWITQGHGNHPKDVWEAFTTDDGHFVAGQGDPNILYNGCAAPAIPTNTPIIPTSTNTQVPPTDTNTPVPPTHTNTPVPPTRTNTPVTPTRTNTPVTPTRTNTPVPPTRTNTPVPPTRTDTPVPPTRTDTPVPPTHTDTPVPPTRTDTPIPPTRTDTPVPPTLTSHPIQASSTGTPIAVVAPEAGSAKILFPVTGTDTLAFSRELPGIFANICLGFLGLGLVLNGLARRFEK